MYYKYNIYKIIQQINQGALSSNNGNINITSNTIFINNFADQGGAITFATSKPDYILIIDNTTFINNTAANQDGAIYIFSGIYNINNIYCLNNIAKGSGGVLYDGNGFYQCIALKSILLNSIFISNIANEGDAIMEFGCNIYYENNTFLNNFAINSGGALQINSSSGNQTIKTNNFLIILLV